VAKSVRPQSELDGHWSCRPVTEYGIGFVGGDA